jgi:hypothetical protein
MELIQSNCANLPDDALMDCSRGMLKDHPLPTDEVQMRAFWHGWQNVMA